MDIHASVNMEEWSDMKGEADGALGRRTPVNKGPGSKRLLRAQCEVCVKHEREGSPFAEEN